ncbi:helix-turn-helix domain-containing protein [Bradyrhizobium sp. CB1650]|uniref:helix-turn-helix transcriptional regulator n=1 Tax=Bradyrhizobium sp. CB1650 TaxID=3039153 RepID=UPI002435B3D5|nr:helix-turn-helix transcriptional regulator [Bradyrhizobium sp. CB1650]WGD49496.1 helix-turn-helix domain-containing protein [Bradyrhizobium sp. CB1650]
MPRLLLDGISIGAVLLDAESGRIAYVNNAARRALAYDAEELPQLTLHNLLHPAHRDAWFANLRRVVNRTTDPCRFDALYLAKDGRFVRMKTVQSGITTDDGSVKWIGCLLEQVPAAHDEATSDLAGVTIWRWSVPGRPDGRGAYRVLAGPPPASSEATFDMLTAAVHPDDLDQVQGLLRRGLSGAAGMLAYRELGSDGDVRWTRQAVNPVGDSQGQVTHLIGIDIDITERRERNRTSENMLHFIQHLQTQWDKPLVIGDVARQHGVSLRAVQKHFASRGTSVAEFLKRIRLVNAYDMLAQAGSRTTVTKVCAKCGFGNLGHFARDYRSEFGELPSDTLLRGRMRRP